jgi:hypothetical protein
VTSGHLFFRTLTEIKPVFVHAFSALFLLEWWSLIPNFSKTELLTVIGFLRYCQKLCIGDRRILAKLTG